MGYDINWNLLGRPVDIGGEFQAGLRTGQTRSALANYQTDPVGSINALMPVDPALASSLQGSYESRQLRQAEERRRQEKVGQDKQEQDRKVIARLAQNARDPATWDQAVDQAVAMGYPDAAQFRGKFSPAVRAAIMAAGDIKDEAAERKIVVIDGVAFDEATGKALFESPYDKVIGGAGGIHVQPRMGIGRGGAETPPAARVEQGQLPTGWEVIDDEGGAGSGGPQTFP